jgi:sugar lactone lactonase YvrE
MEDGKNDHIVAGQPYGTFYAGSWPINNQVMYEALQFAGYDVRYEIGDNAHSGNHAASILPDAMRWLWRDYPKPILAGEPQAMGQQGWDARGQVAGIVSVGKQWELVGPAVTNAATDKEGNVVSRDAASGLKVIRYAPNGRLYATQPVGKRIVSFAGAGGDEKVVAQNIDPGDLAITAKGEVYFTDPTRKTVSLIDAAGKTRVVYNAGEIARPYALTLTPDQAFLIVGDAQSRFSWNFQIAADGDLINGEPFFRVDMPELTPHSEVNGITVDNAGQVYFADAIGIQMCEPNGRCAAILNKPEPGALTSLTFGGKDWSYLYATVNGKLFRRPTKRTGVAAWSPVKPPRPLL